LAAFRTLRLRQSFQRPYGKKFVAAGVATKRRKTEQTSDGAQRSRHMFGRNSLQIEIAADGAMGIAPVAYGQWASAEAQLAVQTSPGNEADNATSNIWKAVAPGAAAGKRVAGWAGNHR
jgi:hypothetical protein